MLEYPTFPQCWQLKVSRAEIGRGKEHFAMRSTA